MAKLVTGRFDDADQVKRALAEIEKAGFAREEYGVFYVAPPGQHDRYPIGGDAYRDAATEKSGTGAVAGAALGGTAGLAVGAVGVAALPIAGLAAALAATGVGAYIGAFMGAMSQTRDPAPEEATPDHPVEPLGGVRIAINVDQGNETLAEGALRLADAKDIAHAEGRFEDREWRDFDPTYPPVGDDPSSR